MDKASVLKAWDEFRTVNGTGLRAVELIPADKLDAHPIPHMRTPKELVCHVYQSMADLAAAVARGEAWDSEPAEQKAAQALQTREALVAWCREKWQETDRIVQGLTEAQLAGTVKTPWGHDFSGHGTITILVHEYWHHRGQLYTYLRALGVAPHSIYDFSNNAPEFRPRAQATA